MATFGISEELVVQLKHCHVKSKSVVETTLKCLFFKVPLESPLDIGISDVKIVSTADSGLWHFECISIQKPRYIGRPVNILCETPAY